MSLLQRRRRIPRVFVFRKQGISLDENPDLPASLTYTIPCPLLLVKVQWKPPSEGFWIPKIIPCRCQIHRRTLFHWLLSKMQNVASFFKKMKVDINLISIDFWELSPIEIIKPYPPISASCLYLSRSDKQKFLENEHSKIVLVISHGFIVLLPFCFKVPQWFRVAFQWF